MASSEIHAKVLAHRRKVGLEYRRLRLRPLGTFGPFHDVAGGFIDIVALAHGVSRLKIVKPGRAKCTGFRCVP
ncbi:MAG TPA: hypothetical protein ENI68_02205 [Gammaproteobacteria bacterium]|nr:hypothetical protein [Gammaproteobacteria bacterium]